MQPDESSPDRILVVDDDRIIVEILKQSLALAGYDVTSAADGKEGLALARALKPDLILLDVMMPKLDGYSVCLQLKEDPATQLIPIIILTALTDRDDKLKALEVGADEFIRKPPDRQELLIRIKSLLRTKKLYDQVQSGNQRTPDREQTDHNLAFTMAHNTRIPLDTIISNLQRLQQNYDTLSPKMRERLLQNSLLTSRQIQMAMETMLDVQQLESGRPVDLRPASISQVVNESVLAIKPLVEEGRVQIDVKVDQLLSPVMLDKELATRILHHLLFNAIKSSPDGGRVGIWVQASPKWIVVNVADQGPGIPKEQHETIFDEYAQLDSNSHHNRVRARLGLAFCKMAIETIKGRIWVENMPGAGALFRLALPVIPATT